MYIVLLHEIRNINNVLKFNHITVFILLNFYTYLHPIFIFTFKNYSKEYFIINDTTQLTVGIMVV